MVKKWRSNKVLVSIIKELAFKEDTKEKKYIGFTAKHNRELNKKLVVENEK